VAYRERLLWEKTKLHQADSAGEEVAVNLASNIGLYLSHINDSSDCPPLGTRGPLSGPLRSRTLIPWRKVTLEGKSPFTLWPSRFSIAEFCFGFECPRSTDYGDMKPTPVMERRYFLQTQRNCSCVPGISNPVWEYRLAYADVTIAAVCALS